MRQNLLDHRPLQDGRDDLQFPAVALRAVPNVDVEHALEQRRPADVASDGLDRLEFARCGHSGHSSFGDRPVLLERRCGTTSERNLAFGAIAPWNLMRCDLGRGTSAASRCMKSSGLITKCVAPSHHGVFTVWPACHAALSGTRSSDSDGRLM